MPAYLTQWCGTRHTFHGVGIGSETHCPGQDDVCGRVPVAVGGLDYAQHVVGLAVQAFEDK